MSNLNFRKRRNRRGFFFHLSRHLPTFIVLFVIALVLGGGIFAFSRFVLKKQPYKAKTDKNGVAQFSLTKGIYRVQVSDKGSCVIRFQ